MTRLIYLFADICLIPDCKQKERKIILVDFQSDEVVLNLQSTRIDILTDRDIALVEKGLFQIEGTSRA